MGYYRWEKLILIEMNVMKRSFEFDDIPINIFIYKPTVFVSLFTFILKHLKNSCYDLWSKITTAATHTLTNMTHHDVWIN